MKKFAPIMLIIGLLTIAVGVLMPIMTNNPFGMTFRYVPRPGLPSASSD